MAASSTPSSRRRLRPVEDIAHTPASSSRGVEAASSVGRVTRRSAAAAAAGPSASLPSGSGSGAAKRSRPSDSHQNQSQTHNDTWSNGSGPSVTEGQTAVPHKPNKRPRKSSSTHTRPGPNQASSSLSQSPRKATVLPPTKEYDVLTHSYLPLPLRPHLPYPIGLTPFRYPCLHPTLPPPPAGDPLNPKWKPYDANHVSHLDPLPDSVRALSALGREPRMARIRIGAGDVGLGLGTGVRIPNQGAQRHLNAGHVLDPELASLPHPLPNPLPIPNPQPSNLQPIVAPTSARHLDPPIPGEGDPTFDINTFFESASYETISALLATGDNVGTGDGGGQTGVGPGAVGTGIGQRQA